jgi:hypothetical protein
MLTDFEIARPVLSSYSPPNTVFEAATEMNKHAGKGFEDNHMTRV